MAEEIKTGTDDFMADAELVKKPGRPKKTEAEKSAAKKPAKTDELIPPVNKPRVDIIENITRIRDIPLFKQQAAEAAGRKHSADID